MDSNSSIAIQSRSNEFDKLEKLEKLETTSAGSDSSHEVSGVILMCLVKAVTRYILPIGIILRSAAPLSI